ncbi:MAG: DUF58 domain-containing protein [Nocardioidaceae bacterium]
MPSELATGASPRARLLVTAGLAALLAGVTAGRPALLVFAVVALVPLLLTPRTAEPTQVSVSFSVPSGQLIEGDPLDIAIGLRLDRPAERLTARVEGNRTIDVAPMASTAHAFDTDVLLLQTTVTATRWGPTVAPTLAMSARSRAGLRAATTRLTLPIELVALPRPVGVGPLAAAYTGGSRAGNHVTSRAGDGVEFAGVRPFAAGDSLRRVHWPVSSRRGELYVTERATEAAMDVVLVIDTLVESGPRGASSLDASLRGAAGLSRALLSNADRVGLVLLGGVLGWLAPASSTRAWYRLMTAALRVSPYQSFVTPDLNRIPQVALPPGALVVLFSPLLDDRVLSVCADLARRRCTTLVIDVLGTQLPPPRSAAAAAGHRLWHLQREATVSRLARLGCAVIHWDGASPLEIPRTVALQGSRSRAWTRA